MSKPFFEGPIINSPYLKPTQHWEFDDDDRPTDSIIGKRRKSEYFNPIPKERKRKAKSGQMAMGLDDSGGRSTENEQLGENVTIMAVRNEVDRWRLIPDPAQWKVTPTTQRLLRWWRKDDWPGRRPFFCQVEAAETLIWLTEVAPQTASGKRLLAKLDEGSRAANPLLSRLCFKLATGAGKTTVMAMIIAWHTLNKVRSPQSRTFTKGFLLVAPGLTIRDRLRVLLPNDPENYYKTFDLVPPDMLEGMQQARVVITNYHAFKLRERLSLSKGNREFLQGRGPELNTLESDGQMIQRVMPELMGMKNIMVINDEAHHCYREKPPEEVEEDAITTDDLKGDEKKQAKDENEAARMWITGLEAVQKQLGVKRVIDLSATPFFLRGSGYVEGTLFPWTCSDFSLMDAIECGIVKLPRVPVADNIPGQEVPMYRNLWDNIRKEMPKKKRGESFLDPRELPTPLFTALEALYGNYKEVHDLWEDAEISVPPCFIIVCNNTATSKLVYDYISGFRTEAGDWIPGALELFSNYDSYGNPLARPNTILVDSHQLESGDALDAKFREAASDEIERFRREMQERSGNAVDVDSISESDLLREVMNTVGEKGRLGEQVRCVVSVSMLTEGWSCNTVTHILGVRAFGTQLLCEQVIGRALRRRNYELNDRGHFDVEYADILGIPFTFAAEAVNIPPQKPVERLNVRAVKPDRDHLEIRFPRVAGYRTENLPGKIHAEWTDDETLVLTPDLIGATKTHNEGIIGEGVDLTLEHTEDTRYSTIVHTLAGRLVSKHYQDDDGNPRMQLFGRAKKLVKYWLDNHLECKGGTYPAQLLYLSLQDKVCERIMKAINRGGLQSGTTFIKAQLDPFNPTGSSSHVNFYTTKPAYQTDENKCPVNYAVLDSGWEGEFCRVAEAHPRVLRYVKNQSLGLDIPYFSGSERKVYRPDFIVLLDDGHGPDDPLYLIVEVKGFRREDVKDKSTTAATYWVPGVNALKGYGRWAFAEFGDVYEMEADFAQKVEKEMERIVAEQVGSRESGEGAPLLKSGAGEGTNSNAKSR